MANNFDKKRHKKALTYTAIICGALLLMFIFISWTVLPPAPAVVQDLMEINLGNNDEGFGEVQPLIKGPGKPEKEIAEQPKPLPAKEEVAEEKITPDDNAEEAAAPVIKSIKKTTPVKITSPTPTTAVLPAPKPKTPKLVYNGPGKQNGNNATQDNGYTMQGNNKNGKGDAGDPTGNKDSYGNTPGGKIGGPKVISGNRKLILRNYSFNDNLEKATINAIIKVSSGGIGTFLRIGQGSTNFSRNYAIAIARYLKDMQFYKAEDESIVTVQFNFNVQ